jgi:thiol-disulfide isomerase/thioredoxin
MGVAFLIMNDRHHRLGMPIGLMIVAVAMTACGLFARQWWYYNPRVAGGIGLGSLAAIVVVSGFLFGGRFEPRVRNVDEFVLSSGGNLISSTSLQGRVVVLAFWASWCGPCRVELPQVERAYWQYRNDNRVAFYAVDVGWDGETDKDGEGAYKEIHLDMPLAYDQGEISKQFGIGAIPALILIDAKGRERFVHRGVNVFEDVGSGLSQHVGELLEEQQ